MSNRFFRCPALSELPEPPLGCHGWPWVGESQSAFAELNLWPRISIIIPSFNQGQYIEETIRSILLQGYPHLELHIIDGGSTDHTVNIIRKYEPWLSSWVSEKDSGQSEAINKGFALCSGEVFTWLCSDDLLTPGTLNFVAELFAEKPGTDVVAGACRAQFDHEPEKSEVRSVDSRSWMDAPFVGSIWQPSCFFRRDLISREELVMTDLHYCMDRELWTYFWSKEAKWHWTAECLSIYRYTNENKSVVGGEKIMNEIDQIYHRYFGKRSLLPALVRRLWLPIEFATRSERLFIRLPARYLARLIDIVLLMIFPTQHLRAFQKEFAFYREKIPNKI